MSTIEGIGQLALSVSSVTRSLAFYRDALGLTLLFEAPPLLAFLDCGPVRLMLSGSQEPRVAESGRVVVYFRVADVQSEYQRLRDLGVTFQRDPHVVHRTEATELWMAFFQDPDGHQLAIMSERTVS